MISVNGHDVNPTIFPDNTSQVWKLPDWVWNMVDNGTYKDFEVKWQYSHESEFMHLAQLKQLLNEARKDKEVRLIMSYLPYALGYKELDSHIGLIYGDAITFDRAKEILTRLEARGFASTNAVFGIGSFTYQHVTRDTYGFAQKSTLCIIDGVEKAIFKDPKTDDGVKKSQKGRVAVFRNHDTPDKYVWQDGFAHKSIIPGNLLTEIYRDGRFVGRQQTFREMRARLREHG